MIDLFVVLPTFIVSFTLGVVVCAHVKEKQIARLADLYEKSKIRERRARINLLKVTDSVRFYKEETSND